MLDGKHVAMQVCNPLSSLRGEAQIAQAIANVRLDTFPKECRIGVDQVGRIRYSEVFGGPGFYELMEQRIQLLWIARIG